LCLYIPGGGSGGALGLYTSLRETKGLTANVKRSQYVLYTHSLFNMN